METTITIEKILEKQASDGRKYYVLRTNQGGFFLWREQLPEGVAVGKEVWIDYRDGKYPKIRAIKPIENEQAGESTNTAISRDERVFRAVALKAAAQLYTNRDGDGNDILRAAEKFFEWLNKRA